MFAGAVRETVFSRPDVIRRISADFVPLATRAQLVANPGDREGFDAERRLFERINRSKPAGQGICTLNSGGQVLDWVLTFDNEKSILEFLDYSLQRFKEFPDAKQPVATQRFRQFPDWKLPEFTDPEKPEPITGRHAEGKPCPAKVDKEAAPPGSLRTQLVGRALDRDSKPSTDTVNQEHYAQDFFPVVPTVQKAVGEALAKGEKGKVRLPDEFGRLCATYAYLGHLDVRPLDNPRKGTGELQKCEFWAEKLSDATTDWWRVEGKTEVQGELKADRGRHWHSVQLSWEGFVRMEGNRMTRLYLVARGTEKLEYDGKSGPTGKNELQSLPAGRPINLECGVRYGIIGEDVVAEGAKP